jgi:serine/threonine-protein kinase RsbW
MIDASLRHGQRAYQRGGQEIELDTRDGESELRISVKVHSDLKYVDLFHTLLIQVAKEVDLSEERVDWLALALREAVNNAVLHGNKRDASKWVEVEMERSEGALFIRVWDEGPGLDESCLRDPRSGENLFKPNGRGIFLIKQFVDDVAFRRDKPGHFGVQMRVDLAPAK